MIHPDESAAFARDYADARSRFRLACDRAGLAMRAYANPEKGPGDETLTCDVAWGGRLGAPKVLVLIAATHGVEGFCGSGAMVDWLNSGGAAKVPDDIGVLLVHALNPHGFAWLRRVTEEGVDLNRNCVDFAQPLPENAAYDGLADAIAPAALEGSAFEAAERTIADFIARHGKLAYQEVLAGGQYRHPDGLFYGGREPSWARRTLDAIIEDFALAERQLVAVIDFHTGLGPSGQGEVISGHRPGTAGNGWAQAWHGAELANPFAGDSVSTVNHGLIEELWIRRLGERVVFVTLEYGTVPIEQVVKALREDQWLHTHGRPTWGSGETGRIKQAMKDAFHASTPKWKAMVLSRAHEIIERTLAGLQRIS
jgi:hypothetical protein